MGKRTVSSAPARIFKAAFVGTRREQSENSGAALSDFIQIFCDGRAFKLTSRSPADLPCVTGVGHQDYDASVKPLGNDSIEFGYLQRGGIEILRIRIVGEQISIALAFNDSMAGEENVNDIFGLGASNEPGADRSSNRG